MMLGIDRRQYMKFKKGNKAAEKGKRICANYPFCKARIPETERPNKAYCTDTCNRYAKI